MIIHEIRQLARELHEVRQEMHKRFDRLEDLFDEHHQKAMQRFEALQFDNVNVKSTLCSILVELNQQKQNTHNTLTTLTRNIKTLSNNQQKTERFTSLKKMVDTSERVNAVHKVEDQEFVRIYSQLMASMKTTHSSNSSLVGNQSASLSDIVSHYESDADNNYASRFYIQHVMNYFGKKIGGEADAPVLNPAVFAYEAITLMTLLKNKYKTDDIKSSDDRISTPEVADLKKIEKLAQQQRRYFLNLRDADVLEKVTSDFTKSAAKFNSEFTEFFRHQEAMLSTRLTKHFVDNFQSYQADTLKQFDDQHVKMKMDHAGWYAGTSVACQNHSHKARNKNNYTAVSAHGYAQCRIAADQKRWDDHYVSVRSGMLKYVRNEIAKTLDGSLSLSEATYQLTGRSDFTVKINYAFILPDVADNPILPIDVIYLKIPGAFNNTEFEGAGNVRLRYRIEDNLFIMMADFVKQNGSVEPIKTILFPYNPDPIYSGSEAIWRFFIGGPLHFLGLQQIQAHTATVHSGPKDWSDYQYYSTVPMFKTHKGFIHSLNRNGEGEFINATVTENILYTDETLAALTRQSDIFKLKKIQSMSDIFISDENSTVAKSLIQYSHRFYMMQSLFDMLFCDDVELRNDSVYLYFKNETHYVDYNNKKLPLIRHRQDLINMLDQPDEWAGDDMVDILNNNVDYFNEVIEPQLSTLFKKLSLELDNIMMENLPDIINALICKYELTEPVTENALVTRRSETELTKQKNAYLTDIMSAMGANILNMLTPEQIQQLADQTVKDLSGMDKGYVTDSDSVLHLFRQKKTIDSPANESKSGGSAGFFKPGSGANADEQEAISGNQKVL